MLDKSRPFGTISGDVPECPGARYVQDGVMFTLEGHFASSQEEKKAIAHAQSLADEAAATAEAAAAKAQSLADEAKARAKKLKGK